jgi:hypothetical protein
VNYLDDYDTHDHDPVDCELQPEDVTRILQEQRATAQGGLEPPGFRRVQNSGGKNLRQVQIPKTKS